MAQQKKVDPKAIEKAATLIRDGKLDQATVAEIAAAVKVPKNASLREIADKVSETSEKLFLATATAAGVPAPLAKAGLRISTAVRDAHVRAARAIGRGAMRVYGKVKEKMTRRARKNPVWTRAYVNRLPDSAFLYIEAGGRKDATGRTVPRSLRHFPVRNMQGHVSEAHARNAIARIPQSTARGLTPHVVKELQTRARNLLSRAQRGTVASAANPSLGLKKFVPWKGAPRKNAAVKVIKHKKRPPNPLPPPKIAKKKGGKKSGKKNPTVRSQLRGVGGFTYKGRYFRVKERPRSGKLLWQEQGAGTRWNSVELTLSRRAQPLEFRQLLARHAGLAIPQRNTPKKGAARNPNSAAVWSWLEVLKSKLTQYDRRLSLGEIRRTGRENIYRLSHYLGAAQEIERECKKYLKRDDAEALAAFERSMASHFTSDMPPVKNVRKQLAEYRASGKMPSLVRNAIPETAPHRPPMRNGMYGGPFHGWDVGDNWTSHRTMWADHEVTVSETPDPPRSGLYRYRAFIDGKRFGTVDFVDTRDLMAALTAKLGPRSVAALPALDALLALHSVKPGDKIVIGKRAYTVVSSRKGPSTQDEIVMRGARNAQYVLFFPKDMSQRGLQHTATLVGGSRGHFSPRQEAVSLSRISVIGSRRNGKGAVKRNASIAPHMWVLSKDGTGRYIVSIGDPGKAGSTLKRRFQTLDELKSWVKYDMPSIVSPSHVVDRTGKGLLTKTAKRNARANKSQVVPSPFELQSLYDDAVVSLGPQPNWLGFLRRVPGQKYYRPAPAGSHDYATDREMIAFRDNVAAAIRAAAIKHTRIAKKNAPAKQPTKTQLAKVASIFRALRKVAAHYDQRVMRASLKVDSTIHVSPRAFAMTRVSNGSVDVRIAPELALEPKNVQVGVLRHEFSHALAGLMGARAPVPPPKSKAYDAIERHADRIAEKVYRTKIFYDHRGVEVSGPGAHGKRPRPAGLR